MAQGELSKCSNFDTGCVLHEFSRPLDSPARQRHKVLSPIKSWLVTNIHVILHPTAKVLQNLHPALVGDMGAPRAHKPEVAVYQYFLMQ